MNKSVIIFLFTLVSFVSAQFVVTSFPFFDDFEGTNYWNTTTNGTSFWTRGSFFYGTFSGRNAWATNSNTTYSNSVRSFLFSPHFDFSSAPSNLYVTFYCRGSMENSFDGVILQYSVVNNISRNWITIGSQSPVLNWYNGRASASPISGPAFTSSRPSWTLALADLGFLPRNTTIQFRFVFASDGSVTDYGFVIDDFWIGSANPPVCPTLTFPSNGALLSVTTNFTWSYSGPSSSPAFSYLLTIYDLSGIVYSVNTSQTYAIVTGLPFSFSQQSAWWNVTSIGIGGSRSTGCSSNQLILPSNSPVETPYFDDFEGSSNWNGQPGWTRRFSPVSGASGNYAWAITSSSITTGQTTYLFSPAFFILNLLNPIVSFRLYCGISAYSPPRVNISYTTDGFSFQDPFRDSMLSTSLDCSSSPRWRLVSFAVNQTELLQIRIGYTKTSTQTDPFVFDQFYLGEAREPACPTLFPPTVSSSFATFTWQSLQKFSAPIFSYILAIASPDSVQSIPIDDLTLYRLNMNFTSNTTYSWSLFPQNYLTKLGCPIASFNLSSRSLFPYIDTFDQTLWNSYPLTGSANSWAIGSPTKPLFLPVPSIPNVMATGLSLSYSNSELSAIVSNPFDFTGWQNVVISFRLIYETEANYDGCNLKVSYDGFNFTTVPTISGAVNWYGGSINTLGNCWTGSSGGVWRAVSYPFAALTGQPTVYFRFDFRSDSSITNVGCAIDNFLISATPMA